MLFEGRGPHPAVEEPAEDVHARVVVQGEDGPPPEDEDADLGRHQTCDFREQTTSAPAEIGGNFTMSREIEPVRRSVRRRGTCTFAEVARLAHSGDRHLRPRVHLLVGHARPRADVAAAGHAEAEVLRAHLVQQGGATKAMRRLYYHFNDLRFKIN